MDSSTSIHTARFQTLAEWLSWLESLHPKAIDLGLERVFRVATQLDLLQPPSEISHSCSGALNISNTTVITVAGTNGKGSCIATLGAALKLSGHSTGSYISPHLHSYNERIRINGECVSDEQICQAFAVIDHARGETSLTYFEFGTLAALWIFKQQQVSYVLLEVGLGGRLDAVNIVDADIAVLTSIDIDHQEWLGDNREVIAVEKLGVTRQNRPVVIAETELTESLSSFIKNHSVSYCLGRDFKIEVKTETDIGGQLLWQSGQNTFSLPLPNLPIPSVAAAFQVLELLNTLPAHSQLINLMNTLQFAGRFQHLKIDGISWVFDVAHNPAAAKLLAQRLQSEPVKGQTVAIFSALADKDISQMLDCLSVSIDAWVLAPLHGIERSSSIQDMQSIFRTLSVPYTLANSIGAACGDLVTQLSEHDRIVVLGSFYTVAEAQQYLGVDG